MASPLARFAKLSALGLSAPPIPDHVFSALGVPVQSQNARANAISVCIRDGASLLHTGAELRVHLSDLHRFDRLKNEARTALSATQPDMARSNVELVDPYSGKALGNAKQLDAVLKNQRNSGGVWLALRQAAGQAQEARIPPLEEALRTVRRQTAPVNSQIAAASPDTLAAAVCNQIAKLGPSADSGAVRAAIGSALNAHITALKAVGHARPTTVAGMIGADIMNASENAGALKTNANIQAARAAFAARSPVWGLLKKRIDAEAAGCTDWPAADAVPVLSSPNPEAIGVVPIKEIRVSVMEFPDDMYENVPPEDTVPPHLLAQKLGYVSLQDAEQPVHKDVGAHMHSDRGKHHDKKEKHKKEKHKKEKHSGKKLGWKKQEEWGGPKAIKDWMAIEASGLAQTQQPSGLRSVDSDFELASSAPAPAAKTRAVATPALQTVSDEFELRTGAPAPTLQTVGDDFELAASAPAPALQTVSDDFELAASAPALQTVGDDFELGTDATVGRFVFISYVS